MTTLHGINYIEALTWRERLELFLCFPAFVVVFFCRFVCKEYKQ